MATKPTEKGLSHGDVIRAPMGPFTAKLEVVSADNGKRVGEVRLIELYDTKKHKPGNNGLGACPHCGRPVHEVSLVYQARSGVYVATSFYRHNPIARTRVIPDRERTHCSKCGKPGEWYTFKPGSGECTECQT